MAQMSQRVKLAPLVAFYRASKYWMPKAFELKEAKQSVYNAFVKANLAASQVYFTKGEASKGAAVCYPWRVAQGTLPPVSYTQVGNVHISNIFLGIDPASFGPSATVGAFSAALLANNLSLREGDQISFILYRQGVYDSTPYLTCNNYEVTIDTASTELLATRLPLDVVTKAGAEAAPCLAVDMTSVIGAFCIVVSRNDGSNLRVSKADLRLSSDSLFSYYSTIAHAQDAAASYGDNAEVFLDPNGPEIRGYQDMADTRQILGVYIGEDAESAQYYPAGALLPASINNGELISLKVSDTANLNSEYAVTIFNLSEQGEPQAVGYVGASDLTATETTITFQSEARSYRIVRFRVSYADGERIFVDFAQAPGGTE
ncbi:MAG: hypothetical protein II275_12210 [Bacteroidaceae bacterium]|nr:hypothetical protein [Bacteroidaceae bacterium]